MDFLDTILQGPRSSIRFLPAERIFVPEIRPPARDPEETLSPEEVIFDKAEKAESLEDMKRQPSVDNQQKRNETRRISNGTRT
jgi:hypothetical protein